MIGRICSLVVVFIILCPLFVAAQQTEKELYETGINFESESNWQEAIGSFKKLVRINPRRHDVWLRMSDIYAKIGNIDEVINSLNEVIKIKSDSPLYFEKLSQAYAVAQNPEKALDTINLALKLDPNNREYLYKKAQLSGWAGKNNSALQAYIRLIELNPQDSEALLGRARVYTWMGEIDRAAIEYKKILKIDPTNKDALFEYSRVEMWRGDYHDTLQHLEKYKANDGDIEKYSDLKARSFAWSSRLSKAREIIEKQLPQNAENFDLNVTNTITLANNNETEKAVESLQILERLKPDDPETKNVKRFVLTPLRSDFVAKYSYYRDSDGIRIFTPSADFQYVVNPRTRIYGGVEFNFLRARLNSGFENINGSRDITHQKLWLGIGHRFSPRFSLEFAGGGAKAQSPNTTFVFDTNIFVRPTDRLNLTFYGNRDFYIVSPRSVSLGVKKTMGGVRVNWFPTSRTFVDTDFNYGRFSDGNNSFELNISPRRAILRRENFNLDMGVRAWFYGYSRDLNNGYYDPNFGQGYFGTTFVHWKISQNDNINFVFMYGVQRDTFTRKFKFATNGSIVGHFGIYRNVMLRVRMSALNNSRTNSGAFRGFLYEAGLTFRF